MIFFLYFIHHLQLLACQDMWLEFLDSITSLGSSIMVRMTSLMGRRQLDINALVVLFSPFLPRLIPTQCRNQLGLQV
jgi:hypothetical protein